MKDDKITLSYKDKTKNFLRGLSPGVIKKTYYSSLEWFISFLQLDRLRHPKIYKLTDAQRSAITLSGDFRGHNFSGMHLKGVAFTGADFSGSNFSRVNVTGAKFSAVLFKDADLSGTDFSQAKALVGVTLPGAKFGDSLRFSHLFGLNLEQVKFTSPDDPLPFANTHFAEEDLSAHIDNPLAYRTIDSLTDPTLKITRMEELIRSAAQRSGYINWDALPIDLLFKPAYLESQTVSDFIDKKLIPEVIKSGRIALWMKSRANVTLLTYFLNKYNKMDSVKFSRFVMEKNQFFIQFIHQCRKNDDLALKAMGLYEHYASLEGIREHARFGHYANDDLLLEDKSKIYGAIPDEWIFKDPDNKITLPGSGDVNGDGRDDVVLRRTRGDIDEICILSGSTDKEQQFAAPVMQSQMIAWRYIISLATFASTMPSSELKWAATRCYWLKQ